MTKEVIWRGKKYPSLSALAKEKGVTVSAVSRWMKEDKAIRSEEYVINGKAYKKSYIKSLAKKHDLTVSVVMNRMRRGVPVGSKVSSNTPRYKFRGKMRTLPEIAEITGIPYQTIFKRQKKGIPFDAPIVKTRKPERKYTHKGKKYTAKELAQMYDIPLRVMRARLQQGTPIDKPYVPKKKSE